jgi:hypothetical protein
VAHHGAPPYTGLMRPRGTVVALVVGVGVGLAAAGWLLRDRLAGKTSNEPSSSDPADLTEIKGIGPVYRGRLVAAGITDFDDLIAAGPEAVAAAAEVLEPAASDWIAQATALQGPR